MNFKDQYKRTFSAVSTSTPIRIEEMEKKAMKNNTVWKPALSGAAIALLCVGTAAYGADLGGLRTKMQTWISGEPQNVMVTVLEPGHFFYQYAENGEQKTGGGGGVKMNEDGTYSPVEAADFMETLAEGVNVPENGDPIYYWKSLQVPLTKEIAGEDGTWHLMVHMNGQKTYRDITIHPNGSYHLEGGLKPKSNTTYYEIPAQE